MLKNKKILSLLVIVLIVIIVGIVIIFTKGMNYGLLYDNNKTIELYLEAGIESTDINSIIKEVFGDKIKIRQVNNLQYDILITTKSASDEQLNNLVFKVNEKYGLDIDVEDLIVTDNAKISGIDLVSPYLLPVSISTILILIYFIVRYKKLKIFKVSLITITTIIFIQLLLLSIYAIIRLPINEYTMPISMILYLISVIVLTEKFENDLEKLKKEQN